MGGGEGVQAAEVVNKETLRQKESKPACAGASGNRRRGGSGDEMKQESGKT